MVISWTTAENLKYQGNNKCIQISCPNHTESMLKNLSAPTLKKGNKSTPVVPNNHTRQVEVPWCHHSPSYSCKTLTESINCPADWIYCPIWGLELLASGSKSLTLSGLTPLKRPSPSLDIPVHDQIKRSWVKSSPHQGQTTHSFVSMVQKVNLCSSIQQEALLHYSCDIAEMKWQGVNDACRTMLSAVVAPGTSFSEISCCSLRASLYLIGWCWSTECFFVDTFAQVDKKKRWGVFDSDAEESSDEEDVDEEGEGDDALTADGRSADEESLRAGISSVVSGFASSLPSGIETPDMIDLRKVRFRQAARLSDLDTFQFWTGWCLAVNLACTDKRSGQMKLILFLDHI